MTAGNGAGTAELVLKIPEQMVADFTIGIGVQQPAASRQSAARPSQPRLPFGMEALESCAETAEV